MKKQLLTILFIVLPLVSWGEVWFDEESRVNYGYTPGNPVAWVSGASKYWAQPDTITIQSSFIVDGFEYKVDSIADKAFYDNMWIHSVIISDGITIIGENAFWRTKVEEITIPGSVVSIGNGAFNNSCLRYVNISEGVKRIGAFTFSHCRIDNISIPSSVISIGNYAFYDCTSLTDVTLNEGLTSIGGCAFEDCKNLENISIPTSVITIGDLAFANCTSIKEITISANNSIGENAFKESGLTSVTFLEGVEVINDGAFYGCNSLASVSLPEGLKRIGKGAFQGNNLVNITIPSSVTDIGEGAFSNSGSLVTFEFPDGITHLERNVLYGCSKLRNVSIPSNVTSIGNEAFLNCRSLNDIILPEGLTVVGESAFGTCESLKSVTIPGSVVSIGKSAFSYCTGLTDLIFQEGVDSIGEFAFHGCTKLSNLTLPSSLTTIGSCAFEHCIELTSITIPQHVKSIGSYAFGQGGVKEVTSLIQNPLPISRLAFSDGNWDSTSKGGPTVVVYVPQGTVQAYESTEGWNALGNFVEIGEAKFCIENGIEYLCWQEKQEARILCCTPPESNEYVINDKVIVDGIDYTVTSIGQHALKKCNDITSVTIPASIKSIGIKAFYLCEKLEKVTSYIVEPFDLEETTFYFPRFLFVPYGTLSAYKKAKGWRYYEIEEIGEYWTDPENNVNYTCFKEQKEAKVSLSPDAKGYIAIRSKIVLNGDEYPVTRIGDSAFGGCDDLTNITIPSSVTNIGDGAFSSCNLTSVTIPSSVKSTGDYAFSWCSNLTNVIIQEGVSTIGYSAFSSCNSLASVTIPNSVTIIGGRAFEHCGIEKMIIPEGVDSIGSYAFYGCANLADITLPSTLTRVGKSILEYCEQIERVNVNCREIGTWFRKKKSIREVNLGDNVGIIDNRAFEDCSNIESIHIPDSVTSIGEYAFQNCSAITSLSIGKNVESIGRYAFNNCKGLSSVTSWILKPFDVSAFDNDTYANAVLCVPKGTIDAYMSTIGWKQFNIIVEFSLVVNLALTVIDEDGEDITDKVSILWYNDSGNQISAGSNINGVADSTIVYYSVVLNEELGRMYHEVKMQKVVASEEPLTCQLEKIGRVTLEGRVSATDIDKNTMTVNVRQMLNGKWEQNYQTQTNEQGEFSVEVYDDETDITFSSDGYFDTTIHRDGFGGNGNVGTIPVSLLSGFVIAANITMQTTANETTAWVDRFNNIEFTLSNTTKGTVITDFTVQGGSVIIKSGAGVGDNISLTARSKQGIFADANTSFTLKEESNSFDLHLTELGGVDATFASSNNGSTAGYLYNSSNMLVAKGSYVGETLSLRHLPSGTYTLVSMGQSLLFGNMAQLGDLSAVGLTEGTDYVTTRVEIADGTLATASVNAVPRMNDTRFYYTNSNTYFSVNKASVMTGNYVTLSAHIDLKPEYVDKVEEMKLTVDLPEGCQMVENSIIANHQYVRHTVHSNRLTMMLNKEQIESQVRFCVIPTLNQNYIITAIASFDIDGQVQQPIGITHFEAKGFSLCVPMLTADSIISANGTAIGHSEISIYDNDVFIGKTSSKADGSWTASCELYRPYGHSFHNIYAKTVRGDGMELTSEMRQVEFDKYNLVPKKVTMLYNGDNVEFNLIEGTTTPSSYLYVPGFVDFTFLTDFTRNDSTLIKNVSIKVLNSDGTVRTLPATFDGAQNCWVATTMYESSSRLPQNATVEYNLIPVDIPFDSLTVADDNNQFFNMINNYVLNVDTTALAVLEESDHVAVCQYKTLTMESPIYIRIEQLDYDKWITQLEGSDYFTADNNDRLVCVKDSTLADEHAMWIWTNDSKCLIQIELSASNQFEKVFSFDEVAQSRHKNIFNGTTSFGELIRNSAMNLFFNIGDALRIAQEYEDSYNDLHRWQGQYAQNVNNHIGLYQKTQSLIEAKCPDGSRRLPEAIYNNALSELEKCSNDAKQMRQEFSQNLDRMQRGVERRRNASTILSATLSMIGIIPGIGEIGSLLRFYSTSFINNIGLATAQDAYNFLIRNQFYTSDQLNGWYYPANRRVITDYSDLQTYVQNAYKKCKEKEDEEDEEDEEKEDEPDFPAKPSSPLIDPSGYVYETVESNRLEGVTTICYQQVNGEGVVWNAEDYSQQNPLKTDATGFYRWDVPQGMWQVKYEKEGYETAYSEWLPVPPPQLDVNIGMKQSTPPTVKQMHGYESGITIEITKYMLPQTMNTENITVSRNGEAETGHIELMNAEQAPQGGENFASKVKFVPDNHFHVGDEVIVTVHKEVESYCGVPMTADHVETVKIEREITAVVADSVVTVPYQGKRELQVLLLPREASAGRTLRLHSSSPIIASVSNEEVTIDQNGIATLTIDGKLPGGAVVDFSIDGTDASATSKIKVVMDGEDLVATPTASIASGSTVEQGTQVVLSCATEGATIYYTLDGSCPCDEQTRLLYSSPITILGDVTIKAIAVKENMDDSDVATFIYLTYPVQVVAKSYAREYGDENPAFDFTVSGGTLDGVPAITCEATATSPVGTYPIVVSKGTESNHNVIYVAGTLTINKAPLTIKAGTYTKRQYEPLPEFTLSYEGFKNDENAIVLTTQPVVTCEATEDSAPDEYPVVVSGAIAQNYDISYVNGTLTVTEPATYTLTYLVDDEVYKTLSLKQNETITPEPEPEKEGYTFSGWSEIPATMPAHDVTVTGTMIPNNYQLVYLVDGLEYKTVDVPFGSAITPEPEPEKEGYTFSGWSEIPETMPAHDVTVSGTFSINSYTLTYMIDEEVYKQTVYEYGAAITPEPAPQGDYISFEWVGVPETMPAHDVTVTAVYETGIAEIMMMVQQGQVRIYAPNGKKLDKLQKGLNIVVMPDGTTKKIVVK